MTGSEGSAYWLNAPSDYRKGLEEMRERDAKLPKMETFPDPETGLPLIRLATSAAKVYGVTYDGMTRVVIAPTFGDAVALWLEGMRIPWGEDWTGDEEPEQVVLISDEPPIGVELEMERRRQAAVVGAAFARHDEIIEVDEHGRVSVAQIGATGCTGYPDTELLDEVVRLREQQRVAEVAEAIGDDKRGGG